MTERIDLPPRDQVKSLLAEQPGAAGLAAVEHRFGVLPLVAAFFAPSAPGGALAELTAGSRRGALGLFTPVPEPGWGTATVEGKRAGEELLLSGEVRIASAEADGVLVLFQEGESGEQRLAWVSHDARGVAKREGGWLTLDGVAVAADLVSRPVTLAAGGELYRHLEAYASLWALAASICARDGVRALRRAARTSRRGGKAFNSSQLVAMAITEVEIEAELTATAVERDLGLAADDDARAGGLALAAAAARVLALLAERTAELRALTGHAPDGPFADLAAGALTAWLGGAPALEGELAGALGIHE